MAIKKIPCGGFYYDDETIEFDGKVISAKGSGGSGGGAMVIEFTTDGYNISANKTVEEAIVAMSAGQVVVGVMVDGDERSPLGVALTDVFSGGIGFAPWIADGELKYFFLGDSETNEWVSQGM